jgi:hypothetical protein
MIAPGMERWRTEKASSYRQSILDFPAPEYATGEVVLGSTYRQLLVAIDEASIELANLDALPIKLATGGELPPEAWQDLLLTVGGLRSPQPAGAHGVPLPQLMPLVPQVGVVACVLGKKRGRANPGNVVATTLLSGSGRPDVVGLIDELRSALSVGPDDDVFARFIESQFARVSPIPSVLRALPRETQSYVDSYPNPGPPYSPPAIRFCHDLRHILGLKRSLTRRQWTVLVESLLRVGTGMHLLWACRTNDELWKLALEVARGGSVPSAAEIEGRIWLAPQGEDPLLEVGRPASSAIKRRLAGYALGRIGLNILLAELENSGNPWSGGKLGLVSPSCHTPAESLREFLAHVAASLASMRVGLAEWLELQTALLSASPKGLLSANASYTKNMSEYLTHGMGQISPSDTEFLGYDQSYALAKRAGGQSGDDMPVTRSRRDASPWVFRLGPSTLVALVHACCRSLPGYPASIEDFRQHLGMYGMVVEYPELEAGFLGNDLRRLGLVIDSPDAAGGRLLVDPLQDS